MSHCPCTQPLPPILTKFLTISAFFLFVSPLIAQTKNKTLFVGNVISDTTTVENNLHYKFLSSILRSKNQIEIRFIPNESFDHTTITILTFNNFWSAKCYSYKTGTDSLISRDITMKTNLDTLFSQLVKNNIFSLPSQENLKTEKYYYNPETNELFGSTMGIGDGICYQIQFKIGDNYRQYEYCNPDDFSEFYSQVYEYKNFVKIVELFKKLTFE